MSSENEQQKLSTDSHAPHSHGLSLEEYFTDNPTYTKVLSTDEDTTMTLWKSKDGSEFLIRLFYMGDCKGAILMDQFEFNRVAELLMKESYS